MCFERGRERKKKKTVLRTVRLTEELNDLLAKDAESKRITVNALISSIFTKYSEWDRYGEKFGFVSVTRSSFRSILEAAGEEKVAEIAKQVTPRLQRDFMLFWFKRADLESFVNSLSLYSKYAGVGQGEIENAGREYIVSVHHDLGRVWSVYLNNLLQESVRTTLGLNPRFEISHDSVTIRFQA